MKAIYIGIQDIFGKINTGGVQCSQKNHEFLIETVGKENLRTILIFNKESNEAENIYYVKSVKNNLEALFANAFLNKCHQHKQTKVIKKYIQEWKPDFIFIDTSNLGKIAKIFYGKYKLICFFHNIESEYTKNKLKKEGLHYLTSYITSYFNERMAVKYSSKIIVLNKRDEKTLFDVYKTHADCKIPICFKDRFSVSKIDKRNIEKELLFIGSNFPPNYHGIKWFIDNVMIKLSEFKLTIVGKDFEKVKASLEKSNVTVIGTVDNLDDYYYQYPCIVMPILYGAGMKVKTAEALMFGKTIFASDEALEGYEVEGLPRIYRCNTAEEYIFGIKNAFKDNKIEKYNEDIRKSFLDNYSFDKQLEAFREDVVDKI